MATQQQVKLDLLQIASQVFEFKVSKIIGETLGKLEVIPKGESPKAVDKHRHFDLELAYLVSTVTKENKVIFVKGGTYEDITEEVTKAGIDLKTVAKDIKDDLDNTLTLASIIETNGCIPYISIKHCLRNEDNSIYIDRTQKQVLTGYVEEHDNPYINASLERLTPLIVFTEGSKLGIELFKRNTNK